jgi:hypothetical protein
MVVHTCSPGYSGGWGRRITWAEKFQANLGNTETLFQIKVKTRGKKACVVLNVLQILECKCVSRLRICSHSCSFQCNVLCFTQDSVPLTYLHGPHFCWFLNFITCHRALSAAQANSGRAFIERAHETQEPVQRTRFLLISRQSCAASAQPRRLIAKPWTRWAQVSIGREADCA